MYELFIEYMDSIFYEGYAKQLASEDSAKFNFELDQFLNLYK